MHFFMYLNIITYKYYAIIWSPSCLNLYCFISSVDHKMYVQYVCVCVCVCVYSFNLII